MTPGEWPKVKTSKSESDDTRGVAESEKSESDDTRGVAKSGQVKVMTSGEWPKVKK